MDTTVPYISFFIDRLALLRFPFVKIHLYFKSMVSVGNTNFKILALTFSALISLVNTQTICDSDSPQCCWVVRM
jgi:hypothetical protein